MKNLVLLTALISVSGFAQAPKRVIEKDTRVRITNANRTLTHDSIGLLEITTQDGGGYCTGTVIGRRHVVTAAHCLVMNRKMVTEVVFSPAINTANLNAKRPFGTFKSKKFRVLKDYFSKPFPEYDLGIIIFDENLPVDPLPIGAAPSSWVFFGGELDLIIAGYPGDKLMGTLWEGRGLRSRTYFSLQTPEHKVDTAPGQSGSAIRAKIDNRERIIGVHSSGFDTHNEAMFFTTSHIQTLRKWLQE